MAFFKQSTDLRWRAPYHHGPGILIYIAILFVLLWIMVIASAAYTATYENDFNRGKYSSIERPPIQWSNISDCDSTAIMTLFIGVGLDTVHLPIHLILYAKQKLHPVTGLVLSLLVGLAWLGFGCLVLTADICAEAQFPAVWNGLMYTRGVLSFLIGILYLVYMGYAAAAVHAWRKDKKGEYRLSHSDENGMY